MILLCALTLQNDLLPPPNCGLLSSQFHLPRFPSMSFSGKRRPFAHAALQCRSPGPWPRSPFCRGVLARLLSGRPRRRWLHVHEVYCATNLGLVLSWSFHCTADASAIASDLTSWRLLFFFQLQSVRFNPHVNDWHTIWCSFGTQWQ